MSERDLRARFVNHFGDAALVVPEPGGSFPLDWGDFSRAGLGVGDEVVVVRAADLDSLREERAAWERRAATWEQTAKENFAECMHADADGTERDGEIVDLRGDLAETVRERDAARAEVERLRDNLAALLVDASATAMEALRLVTADRRALAVRVRGAAADYCGIQAAAFAEVAAKQPHANAGVRRFLEERGIACAALADEIRHLDVAELLAVTGALASEQPPHGGPSDEWILDACEELHAAHTGASEPISRARGDELRAFLRRKLNEWEPSPIGRTTSYDDAVLALVRATLAEPWRSP